MKIFIKNLNKPVYIYVLLALFSLFMACMSKNYDYDLYARLVVGEYFFNTGWISYQDFLSYTPTHLWFDHEWGSSVIFYAFLKAFGNFGLILIHSIALFFTVFFIIKTQRIQKHAYPLSLCFMIGFILLFAHLNPSIVRCHMFSFMLFSMTLYFLEKTRKFNSNILWWMPLIVIIWNNLHGGVVAGLGLIFIYMVCAILTKQPWLKYFLVLLISTPLLIVNPYGMDYISFLLSANTKNRQHITEWWPVFRTRHVIYYYSAFCTVVITFLLTVSNYTKKRNFDLTKLVILIITGIMGIMHVKLLSLTVIVIAALYYNDIIRFFNKHMIKGLNKIACTVMIIAIFCIPLTHPTIARTDINKFPVLEIEFLKLNKIKGNILINFGTGSYTSYKLYPQNLIYMDGRYEEVYYDREFDNLMYFENAKEDENGSWVTALTNYPTEILIIPDEYEMNNKISTVPGWTEIYKGPVGKVLICDTIKNNSHKYIMPPTNIKYYQAREFEHIGKFE